MEERRVVGKTLLKKSLRNHCTLEQKERAFHHTHYFVSIQTMPENDEHFKIQNRDCPFDVPEGVFTN
jgi:hypothetical protein